MKIYLLGLLLTLALNVIVAAPSDKDKNDGREIQDGTNKSQLDMLSAQKQRLQDQVDDQQQRRYDNDTVEHLKHTVEHLKDTVEHLKDTVEHLKESIAGLSQCEVHHYAANVVPGSSKTYTIYFGRSFTRTPKVETSLRGINWGGTYWGFDTWATSPTTTQFVLHIRNNGGDAGHDGITVAWIACD